MNILYIKYLTVVNLFAYYLSGIDKQGKFYFYFVLFFCMAQSMCLLSILFYLKDSNRIGRNFLKFNNYRLCIMK